ncbi:MAG: histidinol dehydrogenase, partial [Deltaproteobacteria bacterium]|nr:histidinol dehydrogenase [Deltaproteobacteria bacterium]
MVFIKPEKLTDLSPERKETLIKRSMEDISDIYEETRDIVRGVQKGGDQVILKHYRKHKSDIRPKDLLVQPEEIKASYKLVDKAV